MAQPEQKAEFDNEIENQESQTDDPQAEKMPSDEEAPRRARANGPSLVATLRDSRLLAILAALVVVQLVLVAVVFLLPRGGTAATASTLLPGVSVDAVNGLTIADDTGQSIALARAGDGWVLPDADGYPANGSSVDALIEQIGALETGTVIAENASSHARLQVAEDAFARRVDLTLGGGDAGDNAKGDSGDNSGGSVETLFIGSTAGGGATHVRAGGNDTVYLSSDISAFDVNATATSWIDPIFFSVAQPDVQTLTLTNISGTVEFARGADAVFTLVDLAEGETFNENNLTSLLATLSGVNMVAPIGLAANQGFNTNLGGEGATVVVTTQNADGDAATKTLQVGKQLEDGNYAVTSSESDYAVEVASFTVEPLLTRARSDFLAQPEPTEALSDTNGLTGTEPLTRTDVVTDVEIPVDAVVATSSVTSTDITSTDIISTEAVSAAAEITPEVAPGTEGTDAMTSSGVLTESQVVTEN